MYRNFLIKSNSLKESYKIKYSAALLQTEVTPYQCNNILIQMSKKHLLTKGVQTKSSV